MQTRTRFSLVSFCNKIAMCISGATCIYKGISIEVNVCVLSVTILIIKLYSGLDFINMQMFPRPSFRGADGVFLLVKNNKMRLTANIFVTADGMAPLVAPCHQLPQTIFCNLKIFFFKNVRPHLEPLKISNLHMVTWIFMLLKETTELHQLHPLRNDRKYLVLS